MLGYLAYVLICAFGFLQLVDMVRGENRDLGRLPLVSLITGLALLQFQVMRDGAPLYIIVGNAASLIASVLNLLWTQFLVLTDPGEYVVLTPMGMRATDPGPEPGSGADLFLEKWPG